MFVIRFDGADEKAEEEVRAANQAKADSLAEQARQEMIAEAESGGGGAAEGGGAKKPGRRQSALAGMGIFEGLKAGPTLGGAEEDPLGGEGDGAAKPEASAKSSANVADIMSADAGDESLRKYKESLLGTAAAGDLGDTSDARKLVVTEFRVIFEDAAAPDAVFDMSSEAGTEALKTKGIAIKEGANFKFQLSFRVNHELLEGLKYVNKTKRSVVRVRFFGERRASAGGSCTKGPAPLWAAKGDGSAAARLYRAASAASQRSPLLCLRAAAPGGHRWASRTS